MAASPTTDPFRGQSSLEGPSRGAVALTYAMISDTVDLTLPAKAFWFYNGHSADVTLNVIPTDNEDADVVHFTLPAGGYATIPQSIRRIKSTGSTNLITTGAITTGVQVNLFTK